MIYKKRSQWCFRDESGKLHKFNSEWEAKIAYGKVDAQEEIQADIKEEVYEENSDEQEALLEGEGGSEEEV